jgi:hypothetical protein
MAAKVEANISDQFNYVSQFVSETDKSFLGIIENLSSLQWDSPLYDDTKPSYNLSFNAVKTTDTPAGTFSIKHTATGDLIDSSILVYSNENKNGTRSDSIVTTYGTFDKASYTESHSSITKPVKNGTNDVSTFVDSLKYDIISSNNTNDKIDDFTRTLTYSYSGNNVAKDSFSEIYKSLNLNYSDSHSSKYGSNGSGSTKISFSNHNLDAGNIVTANIAFSYTNSFAKGYMESPNISSADFKIAADDKSSLSSLSFSGGMLLNNDLASVNIKNFTFETADFKFVSGAVKTEISLEDYHAIKGQIRPSQHLPENFTEENINGLFYIFKILNQGDNTIIIKNSEGTEINAGIGKDIVVGGIGDDTIIGGAGSDKLTGGKGLDTFRFALSDFISENASGGDSVFNKSTDTITDFNLKDGDVLDFGDLGELSFYAKLADAKLDNAQLFYVKGSGSIYLNTSTTDGFTPTVIITLTGKPALNADGTDWNYPA